MAVTPNPSLERDLHRHGTRPASRLGPSSGQRAKRHTGVGPSAQTLGRTSESSARSTAQGSAQANGKLRKQKSEGSSYRAIGSRALPELSLLQRCVQLAHTGFPSAHVTLLRVALARRAARSWLMGTRKEWAARARRTLGCGRHVSSLGALGVKGPESPNCFAQYGSHPPLLALGQLMPVRITVHVPECALTLRSSGLAPAWHSPAQLKR